MGKQVTYLPKCHSTNDIAADLLTQNNFSNGQVIITDYQYAGRGQRGNTWDSEKGMNLTFSIILEPDFLEAAKNFYLSMAISLGIIDALSALLPDVKIKWPNDLYYENKKIGGILIESNIRSGKLMNSIAGIGINVNQESFTITKASSLKKILGHELQRDSVFQKIISGIDKRYLQLQQKDHKSLKDQYLKNMYRYKEESFFRSDKDFSGQIAGIDENGQLQISSGGQIMSFGFKEIEFLD